MIGRIVRCFSKELRLIGVYAAVMALLFSGCYPEWKMARTFIASEKNVAILLLPANYVFKNNLKVKDLTGESNYSDWEKDSLMLANSQFLKQLSDSVFLETLVNSMIDEFEQLGFTVYMENTLDSFLFVENKAYIFNIAQVELEEHFTVHEARESIDEAVYVKKLDLNALSYNFWFELSEMNDATENPRLFYSSETINDVVSGYFAENMFTGEVKYRYQVSELDMEVVYRYADIFARKFAGYTFDHIMNQHLDDTWPPNKKRRYYMHYKRNSNTLDPAWEDRFIELDMEGNVMESQ